jgi:disulfide oxidoreductase YuzD
MEKPVDLDKLRNAIRIAFGIYNWRVVSATNSEFVAEFGKGSNDKVQATIKVDYSDAGYKIEYVDSQGLNADLEHKTIHRNYVRWVNNLDKQIYLNYYRQL